jgi:N-acetylneuraminic acid mutarotase
MKKTTFAQLLLMIPIIISCTKPDVVVEDPKLVVKNWVDKKPFPAFGRDHPITFTIGQEGYAGMGSYQSSFYTDFYKYNPKNDAWTKLKDFPGAKRGISYGVTSNGFGYMGFGKNEKSIFNDWWQFDPKNDTWKELKTCDCGVREHPAMVALGNKIFVGLGNDEKNNLNDWWEYDIDKNTWAQKANFPGAARHHPYFFSINGLIYVGFGHGSVSINGVNIYKDFYQYSPNTNTWKKLNDFPAEGRVAGTQFEYKGEGYILSGQGELHQNFTKGEFWKYNPQSDSWSGLTPHKGISRWAPGSFLIDKQLYFVGGQSNKDYLNDLQVYTFE